MLWACAQNPSKGEYHYGRDKSISIQFITSSGRRGISIICVTRCSHSKWFYSQFHKGDCVPKENGVNCPRLMNKLLIKMQDKAFEFNKLSAHVIRHCNRCQVRLIHPSLSQRCDTVSPCNSAQRQEDNSSCFPANPQNDNNSFHAIKQDKRDAWSWLFSAAHG